MDKLKKKQEFESKLIEGSESYLETITIEEFRVILFSSYGSKYKLIDVDPKSRNWQQEKVS